MIGVTNNISTALDLVASQPDTEFMVLIGSTVRGTADRESDVDVLVGSSGKSPLTIGPPGLHLIYSSIDELAERIDVGDDFPSWCLLFGKPIAGEEKWALIKRRLLAMAPWPAIRPRLTLAKRQFTYARSLVQMGDIRAASLETRIGLNHLARLMLLRARVFPLSRPELPSQLSSIGYKLLAEDINRLGPGHTSTSFETTSILRRVEQLTGTIEESGPQQPGSLMTTYLAYAMPLISD